MPLRPFDQDGRGGEERAENVSGLRIQGDSSKNLREKSKLNGRVKEAENERE